MLIIQVIINIPNVSRRLYLLSFVDNKRTFIYHINTYLFSIISYKCEIKSYLYISDILIYVIYECASIRYHVPCLSDKTVSSINRTSLPQMALL